MKTNQTNPCVNVSVNCCCSDDNGGTSFLGTKVYVDSRNTNESPDGSVNNPFATLEDAFAYVDSTDESYVVHIINAGEKPSVEYTFTKKGNLGIVGDLTYNIENESYMWLLLHLQNDDAIVCVDGLKTSLTVYGGRDIYLNNLFSQYIKLYDTRINVRINNCRGVEGVSNIILASENDDEGLIINNLVITNSSLDLEVNRRVYYAWATNSYFTGIKTSLQESAETLIQFTLNGCFIGYIQREKALEGSSFTLTSCWLNGGVDADDFYVVIDTDIALPYMDFTNYTPERNTLISHLKALDKKIGELQAQINS